jgi:hypothetical protein
LVLDIGALFWILMRAFFDLIPVERNLIPVAGFLIPVGDGLNPVGSNLIPVEVNVPIYRQIRNALTQVTGVLSYGYG